MTARRARQRADAPVFPVRPGAPEGRASGPRRVDGQVQKLMLALDQSPASVLITDATGKIEYVNRRFTQVTGYEADVVLGKNPRLLGSGLTPAAVYGDLWKTIRAGRTWHGELRNRRRNGDLYWDAVVISPLRDDAGVVTHFLATQEDVTERKRFGAELRSTQARLHQVLASSDAVIYTLALADGNVVPEWVSDNIVRLTGYEVADALGAAWWTAHLHPDDRGPAMAALSRLWTEGRLSSEYRFQRRDGTYMWIHDDLRLVSDAEGRPVEAVGAWIDITERRRLEDEVRQAQKMEAMGRLAGGVAHDFNNVLTVISSYANLLLDDLDAADPRRPDVEEIRSATSTAASLTRQLLAFSRRQVLEPRILDLNAVIIGAERLLRRLIGEDIDMAMVLAPGVAAVRADPGQLEQVLMNLAVNARDAMPNGGRLTFETAPADVNDVPRSGDDDTASGAFVRLSVRDTGVGMSADTRARVFEPFFTTKELGKGTGLGLATVYGIVTQSGGVISVDTAPGAGTVFNIYLPAAAVPADPVPATEGRPRSPGRETVLIVEDAAPLRGVARQVLSRCGYTVLEAGGGEAALQIAAAQDGPIDLLLTDIVMPGMSGGRLARRLAKLRPDIKVLFMSGYTDEAVVRHGGVDPGAPLLQKPFAPDDLARMVREVLDADKPTSR